MCYITTTNTHATRRMTDTMSHSAMEIRLWSVVKVKSSLLLKKVNLEYMRTVHGPAVLLNLYWAIINVHLRMHSIAYLGTVLLWCIYNTYVSNFLFAFRFCQPSTMTNRSRKDKYTHLQAGKTNRVTYSLNKWLCWKKIIYLHEYLLTFCFFTKANIEHNFTNNT